MNPQIRIFLVLIFSILVQASLAGQSKNLQGSIEGAVVDAETRTPLMGTNVILEGTELGSATDDNGKFLIENVPVGSYVLRFDFIGYEPLKQPNIIVRSKRITFVNAELRMATIAGEEITVTGGYFSQSEDQPVSLVNFSSEEIRRAPGSAGDVSRILMSLPSVAKVNDQSNNLIVRGGNPVENTFFIDNIEIPNINHFPDRASSGGPIGMVNVDFIQDVNFSTGGFSAIYGDKLSSIMDITFREGNRNEFDAQLDLNFTGFGGVAEGPLFGPKGSWMVSARRSYLDFVVDLLDVGSTVAPVYGDVQWKLVYDLNPAHKLMFIGVFGDDHNSPDREVGQENKMTHYGNQDIYQRTTGLNWRALWGKSGYSNTSVSYTSSQLKEDFYETNTGLYAFKNHTHDQTFALRNVNHFRLNNRNSVEFGAEAKYLKSNYNNFYAATTGDLGNPVPALYLKDEISAQKLGGFVNYILIPIAPLTLNFGARSDYFSYNENLNFSPRVAFTYQLSPLISIHGAAGLYFQNLPLQLLAQSGENKQLKDPEAIHYIAGITYLLTESTQLTLEAYQKNYRRFPLDVTQPALFPIDESYIENWGNLVDKGEALARGVELMLQKKLAQNFYGLASVAYFRSRYKGGDGIWRDRDFDNRLMFSVEGGFKPNSKWEFSTRWIYAGGAPYTPMDLAASALVHRAVYDANRINEARYPDYHSMNLRFDRRFHFSSSNLIFYLSVWNVYNRKNLAEYYWNDQEQKQDEIYQWLVLPVFGLEYEL